MNGGHCVMLEDEVRLPDREPFKIQVYVMASDDGVVDEFTARRVIGAYKHQLDEDYED